jgi:hypothetical protein
MYGFIKLDASYDCSRTTPGNYVKWVDSEAYNCSDDEFNITANQTRVGFKIKGPETENMKTSGQLEWDLYGSSGESYENKPKLMTRHAFLKIENPKKKCSLIAGQTWDVVSPLNPTTLNYSVLWWAGNYGYRRPQIRLTKDVDLGNDMTLKLQGAVARTIGTASGGLNTEPGADAGFPMVQGRASVTLPGIGPKPIVVGVSGHWGQEEHDYMPGAEVESTDADTWSGCVDVTLPISNTLTVKGEIQTGANYSALLGGIGQGVTGAGTSAVNEIRSAGGWIAAAIGPFDTLSFNVGAGRQECARVDVPTSGGLLANQCIFGNAIHKINKNASVGIEVSQWDTKYINNPDDGDAFRGQVSFIYKN